jgi:hypothetical protein
MDLKKIKNSIYRHCGLDPESMHNSMMQLLWIPDQVRNDNIELLTQKVEENDNRLLCQAASLGKMMATSHLSKEGSPEFSSSAK